jgi:hypothetical protein
MILLLANYLNNIRENFNTKEIPTYNKIESDIENYIGIGSRIVSIYVIICLCAAALSLYLNWRDNQPTSVCLLCALYAWGAGIFYFIFIGIYYMLYYSKNNYYYVEFSNKFNTNNLTKINITELEDCINNLVPKS